MTAIVALMYSIARQKTEPSKNLTSLQTVFCVQSAILIEIDKNNSNVQIKNVLNHYLNRVWHVQFIQHIVTL